LGNQWVRWFYLDLPVAAFRLAVLEVGIYLCLKSKTYFWDSLFRQPIIFNNHRKELKTEISWHTKDK